MSNTLLSLSLDIVVLLALGVAIFVALRLLKSLNSFSTYRQELKLMIQELSGNIDAADKAVENLRKAGEESSSDLQSLVGKSKALVDELRLMNEAGHNMAARLEKLAEKSSRNVAGDSYQEQEELRAQKPGNVKPFEPPRSLDVKRKKDTPDMPGFFIRDKEYESSGESDIDEGAPAELQSQAEKDLFKALLETKEKKLRGL